MVVFQNKGAMAATIVVAASNSLNKAAANYVCDGVADNVEIQAAIDALPTGGGEVVLLEGIFSIAATVKLKSNVQFKGQGSNTVIRLVDNSNVNVIENSDAVGGNNGIRVSDFAIDGNKVNQTPIAQPPGSGRLATCGILFYKVGQIHIEAIYVYNCDVDIDSWYSSKIFVHKCYCIGGLGLGAHECEDVRITNNQVDSAIERGIEVQEDWNLSPAQGTQRAVVAENIINGVVAITNGDGIYAKGSEIIINGNYLKSAERYGIRVCEPNLNYPKNITVSDNIIEESGGFGISMEEIEYRFICANNIVNKTGLSIVDKCGIQVFHCNHGSIIGNVVNEAGDIGIYVRGTATDITVSGNSVRNSGQNFSVNVPTGIASSFITGCVIIGNNVVDNQVIATQLIGISDYSSSIIINGNTVIGSGSHNIKITNTDFLVIANNRCWDGGRSVAGSGIYLDDVRYGVVQGNRCGDSQGVKTQDYGIQEATTSNYNTYKSNHCMGNETGAILILGSFSSFDKAPQSVILDLSGGATDVSVFHATCACQLVGYTILYTEASSADAGVDVRVGRYQSGVALDDDYFDISVSEVSKNLGYSKRFLTADLTNKVIAAGDTITVGTAGGKTGTGEVMIILHIAEMAD